MTMLVRGGAAAGSSLPNTATPGQVLQWNGSAWVAATPSATGTTPNATPTAPGLVQLAGDLAGTATAPTVTKINGAAPATVATTGAYNDLLNRPVLAPIATSGKYADLSGAPALATVATTGAAADLAGLAPVATSGSYGSLTGRPLLATVATTGAYADLTGRPASRPDWTAPDQGFITWTYDPIQATTKFAPNTGSLSLMRVHVPAPATITNVLAYVGTAGAALTASQNVAALYTAAGALVAATADQATAWTSTGLKTMALSSPQTIAAGDYYVALLANGTTVPNFASISTTTNAHNVGVTRYGTQTGPLTAAPATLGAYTGSSVIYWAALS